MLAVEHSYTYIGNTKNTISENRKLKDFFFFFLEERKKKKKNDKANTAPHID